ncbi:hypothetical protein KAX75_11395 [candidate division WOR-3 bacterium]|nr:hypothetical protein [candidate division WOR-3 bacterium]
MRPFFATINNVRVLVVNSFSLLYDKDTGVIGKVRFLILNYGAGRNYWQLVVGDGVKFEQFATDEEVESIINTIKNEENKKKS